MSNRHFFKDLSAGQTVDAASRSPGKDDTGLLPRVIEAEACPLLHALG